MIGKLESLTAIRFFAAFFVLLSHLSFLKNTSYKFLFVEDGFIGVTLFFILSGFVLSYSYGQKIREKRITFKNYILSRVFRIYPLHLITLIIALPLVLYNFNIKSVIALLPNIFLLQSYIPLEGIYFSGNAPSWSISDEMFFYLCFPFLVLISSRKLVCIFSALIIAQIFLLIFINDEKIIHAFIYISPFFRISDFLLGILIYRVFAKKSAFIDRHASLLQFFSISILTLFISAAYYFGIHLKFKFSIYYIIPMALLILSIATRNGFLSKILHNKILIFLGESSFALYLIHQLVIRYITAINNKMHLFTTDTLVFLIFLISLGSSFILFLYFEKPMQSKLNKKFISQKTLNRIENQKEAEKLHDAKDIKTIDIL